MPLVESIVHPPGRIRHFGGLFPPEEHFGVFKTWVVISPFIHLVHSSPLQFGRFLVQSLGLLRVHQNACLNFKIFSFALIQGWFILWILRSATHQLLKMLFTWYLTEKSNEKLQTIKCLSYLWLFGFEKKLPWATRRSSAYGFSHHCLQSHHFFEPISFPTNLKKIRKQRMAGSDDLVLLMTPLYSSWLWCSNFRQMYFHRIRNVKHVRFISLLNS